MRGQKEDPKLIFFKYLEPEIYASLTAEESIITPKYAELIFDSSLINAENYEEANFNHDTQSNPRTTSARNTSINISYVILQLESISLFLTSPCSARTW